VCAIDEQTTKITVAYITYDKHIDPKIREILGGLIDANMQTTCRDFALRKGPDADSSMLTIQALAETFGVTRAMLQRLAGSGMVPVARAQGVRPPVRMAVRDVMPLLLQMKDAVSDTAAAGLIGLPLSVLPSLVDHGLIRRLQGPVCGLLPGFSGCSKSSIEDLMDKVWAAALPAPDKCSSIAVAARSLGAGETPWAAIISAIISGNVAVFVKNTKRRNIRFGLAVEDIASFAALSDKAATSRAQRENQIWEVDVAILDVPGRPRVVTAVDLHSRLPTVAAVTSGAGGDIAAKLDAACRPFGYPQEICIDGSFEFASPALKEWAEQHDVTLTFRPPRPASKAIFEKLQPPLGVKPAGDE
jgi:hypothetical protein